jgi:hypothetical protein
MLSSYSPPGHYAGHSTTASLAPGAAAVKTGAASSADSAVANEDNGIDCRRPVLPAEFPNAFTAPAANECKRR